MLSMLPHGVPANRAETAFVPDAWTLRMHQMDMPVAMPHVEPVDMADVIRSRIAWRRSGGVRDERSACCQLHVS
jgi:hypothetical protein